MQTVFQIILVRAFGDAKNTLRHFLWRLGRKLYCIARYETSLGPNYNGEYAFFRKVLIARGGNFIAFDIGGHLGEWTSNAITQAKSLNTELSVYTFEPAPDSFRSLSKRFLANSKVILNNTAVSNESGTTRLFVDGIESGTNSIYPTNFKEVLEVKTTSIDDYRKQLGAGYIDYLKCDTEGNDFNVILGARNSLELGVIGVLQFEYNHRWIYSRTYLRDVFVLISDTAYVVGKIGPFCVEIYEQWHNELERFFESNFVLIRRDLIKTIPDIRSIAFGCANIPIATEANIHGH